MARTSSRSRPRSPAGRRSWASTRTSCSTTRRTLSSGATRATRVTKEAADMILTDDNFATIVSAVEGGREIYDNLMKYIRVQLIMLGGFILTFLLAGIFNVAGGTPLTPLQILWINFAVDVLLAIGLGFDAPVPGLMQRRPRDANAPVVDRDLAIRLGFASVVMAVLAVSIVSWGEHRYDLVTATTME